MFGKPLIAGHQRKVGRLVHWQVKASVCEINFQHEPGIYIRRHVEGPAYDIARDFPPGEEVTLFADDLAVFATEKTIAGAEERVQAALNELRKWAELWKMDVRHHLNLRPSRGAEGGSPVPRKLQTPTRTDTDLPGSQVRQNPVFQTTRHGHQGQDGEEMQRPSSRQREGLGRQHM